MVREMFPEKKKKSRMARDLMDQGELRENDS